MNKKKHLKVVPKKKEKALSPKKKEKALSPKKKEKTLKVKKPLKLKSPQKNTKVAKKTQKQETEIAQVEVKRRTTKKDAKFKIGEMIVYPFHGVGIIRSIEKINVIGEDKWYYTIDFRNGELTVRTPIENQNEKGMRKVISKSEVDNILGILKKRHQSEESDWKVRYNVYLEKLKSGDIYEAAKVARNLSKRGPEGELSMSEKRLLESAVQLLIHEIAYASKKSLEDVEQEISKYLRAGR